MGINFLVLAAVTCGHFTQGNRRFTFTLQLQQRDMVRASIVVPSVGMLSDLNSTSVTMQVCVHVTFFSMFF